MVILPSFALKQFTFSTTFEKLRALAIVYSFAATLFKSSGSDKGVVVRGGFEIKRFTEAVEVPDVAAFNSKTAVPVVLAGNVAFERPIIWGCEPLKSSVQLK